MVSTHNDFFDGQTDRSLNYWPDHSGETRLFKQEEEERCQGKSGYSGPVTSHYKGKFADIHIYNTISIKGHFYTS